MASQEPRAPDQKTNSTRPPLNILHISHGFSGPYPDFSEGYTGERISGQGSALVFKITPDLVVKYGTDVKATEVESLLFVEKHVPRIPAPRVHAYYTIGPFDRDLDDYGSLYDTYIIMTFVPGKRLDEAWEDLDDRAKASIAAQLREHMQELRALPQGDECMIGSVRKGPLLDPMFTYHCTQGPFATQQDFNKELVAVHEKVMSKANLRYHIEGALAQNSHKIVLTHGDLQGRNIMVDGDKLVGIVDWETCGWYPEYWEFAKCFHAYGWPKDWPNFVSQVLEPYFSEWVLYDLIRQHVW